MIYQAEAAQSTFDVPHQNVLPKSSSKPGLNNTEPAFKSNFNFLTTEYSHAQNQLNTATSHNFMHGDIFQLHPLPIHTTKAILSFLFSDRDGLLMVKAGCLS